MNIHELPKITTKKKKRMGLGHGSGRVKTAGRGTKGQKARTKIPLAFEGGALALVKRMPFLRGKGKNRGLSQKPFVLPVSVLNKLPKNATVDLALLISHNIVDRSATVQGVKLLGKEEVSGAYTVKVPVSKSAAEKIQQAGGQVA